MSIFYCTWGQHLVSYRGTGTLLPSGYRICKDCRIKAASTPNDSLELVSILQRIDSARDMLRTAQALDQQLRGKA